MLTEINKLRRPGDGLIPFDKKMMEARLERDRRRNRLPDTEGAEDVAPHSERDAALYRTGYNANRGSTDNKEKNAAHV
jgi:hypothetical protein